MSYNNTQVLLGGGGLAGGGRGGRELEAGWVREEECLGDSCGVVGRLGSRRWLSVFLRLGDLGRGGRWGTVEEGFRWPETECS